MENQKAGLLKILFLGDIVGRPGRRAVASLLPNLRSELEIDLVFANGENLAGGKGMTKATYDEMIEAGIDYFTSGNHIWNNSDIIPYLKEQSVKILRPENYPAKTPGAGVAQIEIKGVKVTLANLLGRVFLPILVDDPFEVADKIVADHKDSIIIADLHAEATSEKAALANYLDGRASAVFGTHTHVQTADERILPKGTAFISDLGMCGPIDSVIGVEKEIIIKQFLTGLPQSHKVAGGEAILSGVIASFDLHTKKALQVERFFRKIA